VSAVRSETRPRHLPPSTSDTVACDTPGFRRPLTRRFGALESNTGTPSTMQEGSAAEAAMNSPIISAGCWPSESIVRTCVKPASRASSMPCRTAAPLPPFLGNTITFKPGSALALLRNPSAVPSVLASTTTHTGFQERRAAWTVS